MLYCSQAIDNDVVGNHMNNDPASKFTGLEAENSGVPSEGGGRPSPCSSEVSAAACIPHNCRRPTS